MRTLLHVLKDIPYDLPSDFETVLEMATRILRVSNEGLHSALEDDQMRKNELLHLVGIFSQSCPAMSLWSVKQRRHVSS